MGAKRNDSIELLRDILMLGICILHSCSLGGYPKGWVCRLLMPCVPCFIFISGYYGIKATPMRIFRLIAIAFSTVPAVGVVSWLAGYGGLEGWKVAAAGVADNWFVWAYVALMCFAPALNLAVESGKRLSITLPIIAMTLGWGYLKGLPWFRTFMPTTDGLGGFTFTMMVGVYLVARLCRQYDLLAIIRTAWLLVLFAGLTVLCIVGFSAYCSPVSVAWSAVLFALFSRIEIGESVGAVVSFVAKSTFPIFVLHANGVGFGLIRKFASWLCDGHGWNAYGMYLVVGATVFLAGLILDMPRRFVKSVTTAICGTKARE